MVRWAKTTRSFLTVMLAGALEPSPLQRQLNLPPLCLPTGRGGTLLEAWLNVISRASGCAFVRVVLNTEADARPVRELADAYGAAHPAAPPISVVAEPAPWRGTAGLIRDLSMDTTADAVIVIEAHCLPPRSLGPLLGRLAGDTNGVVGSGADSEPAGVYVLDRAALAMVPPIGYFDLKEQLLPALNSAGRRIRAVRLTQRVLRLRDRAGYLCAVREGLAASGCNGLPRAAIPTASRVTDRVAWTGNGTGAGHGHRAQAALRNGEDAASRPAARMPAV